MKDVLARFWAHGNGRLAALTSDHMPVRVGLLFFSIVGSFLIVRLHGNEYFGKAALLVFLIKGLPILSLGISHEIIRSGEKSRAEWEAGLISVLMIIYVASAVFTSFYLQTNTILFVTSMAIAWSLEPGARTRGAFWLAPTIELCLWSYLLVEPFLDGGWVGTTLECTAAGLVVFGLVHHPDVFPKSFKSIKVGLRSALRCSVGAAYLGMGTQIFNVLIVLFYTFDRLSLEGSLGAADFGVVMVVYQLGAITTMLLNMRNASAILRWRKILSDQSLHLVELKNNALVLLGLLSVSTPVAIIAAVFFLPDGLVNLDVSVAFWIIALLSTQALAGPVISYLYLRRQMSVPVTLLAFAVFILVWCRTWVDSGGISVFVLPYVALTIVFLVSSGLGFYSMRYRKSPCGRDDPQVYDARCP